MDFVKKAQGALSAARDLSETAMKKASQVAGQVQSMSIQQEEMDIGGKRIRILKELGEGGFSFVFLCCDAQNEGRKYALKRMICRDREQIELATHEVEIMKSLPKHKNLVGYHGSARKQSERGTEIWVLQEFCPSSLVGLLNHRRQQMKPLKTHEVLEIFKDVCNGISVLHGQNPPIAHRDLKLENVLRGDDGHWKLCDFGSCTTRAKIYESRKSIVDEEDRIQRYCTPQYRAPEMCDLYQRKMINHQVDVWAAGCLLYALAYDKLPFDEGNNLQILGGKVNFPSSHHEPIIVELIKKCLVVDPESRPEISHLLSHFGSGESSQHHHHHQQHHSKQQQQQHHHQQQQQKPAQQQQQQQQQTSNNDFSFDPDPFDSDPKPQHPTATKNAAPKVENLFDFNEVGSTPAKSPGSDLDDLLSGLSVSSQPTPTPSSTDLFDGFSSSATPSTPGEFSPAMINMQQQKPKVPSKPLMDLNDLGFGGNSNGMSGMRGGGGMNMMGNNMMMNNNNNNGFGGMNMMGNGMRGGGMGANMMNSNNHGFGGMAGNAAGMNMMNNNNHGFGGMSGNAAGMNMMGNNMRGGGGGMNMMMGNTNNNMMMNNNNNNGFGGMNANGFGGSSNSMMRPAAGGLGSGVNNPSQKQSNHPPAAANAPKQGPKDLNSMLNQQFSLL